jgi:hypothetical protein
MDLVMMTGNQTGHCAEKRRPSLQSEKGMHWIVDLIGQEYTSARVECQDVYRMSWPSMGRMVGGEIALPTANPELYVTVARYTAPQSMVICY